MMGMHRIQFQRNAAAEVQFSESSFVWFRKRKVQHNAIKHYSPELHFSVPDWHHVLVFFLVLVLVTSFSFSLAAK